MVDKPVNKKAAAAPIAAKSVAKPAPVAKPFVAAAAELPKPPFAAPAAAAVEAPQSMTAAVVADAIVSEPVVAPAPVAAAPIIDAAITSRERRRAGPSGNPHQRASGIPMARKTAWWLRLANNPVAASTFVYW